MWVLALQCYLGCSEALELVPFREYKFLFISLLFPWSPIGTFGIKSDMVIVNGVFMHVKDLVAVVKNLSILFEEIVAFLFILFRNSFSVLVEMFCFWRIEEILALWFLNHLSFIQQLFLKCLTCFIHLSSSLSSLSLKAFETLLFTCSTANVFCLPKLCSSKAINSIL